MYGYGNEDLFSSLRNEASHTDCSYNLQRETGNMSDFSYGQSSLPDKNMTDILMNPKRNNIMEPVNVRTKINGAKESSMFNTSKMGEESKLMSFIQPDAIHTMNFEDAMFGNPYEKEFGFELSLPENSSKFCYQPSKRSRSRSSSLSGKDYQDFNSNPKSTNAPQKSKQARYRYGDGSQNYTASTNKSKDPAADKLFSNNFQSSACNSFRNEEKEVEVIDLESIDTCDSNPDDNNKSPSVPVTGESQASQPESDCECISEVIRTPKANTSSCCPESVRSCSPVLPSYSTQYPQLQSSIIENMIKETVSVEFDAVRQLLYLQQMFVFRLLHVNLEAYENHNLSYSEFMLRVIEELLHENRQLKKAVVAQQRKT